ncbi:SCO family protein [bacterium]|nr:MAG: SCO family protein [bacterium]
MNLFARTALSGTAFALVAGAAAQSSDKGSYYDELIRSMGIEQKIGAKADLNARFTDQDGKSVQIGDLLKGRPVLIVPGYYTGPTTCPMLTDNLLKVLARSTKQGTLVLGNDLDIVMLGLNPKEGPKEASARKSALVDVVLEDAKEQVRRNPMNLVTGSASGDASRNKLTEDIRTHWTVLTGSLDEIKAFSDSIGFRYRYDAEKGSVDYPTGSVLLTPKGVISAYSIANDMPTRILEGNVATAKQEKLSEKVDQIQMFGCLSYDPQRSPYRGIVENAIRVTGTLTVLILGFSIFAMSRKPKGPSNDSGGTPKA